jgi:hypothetical protein
MDDVLRGLDFCFAYLDDILVSSRSLGDHEWHLRVLFDCLQTYGILINPAKCVSWASGAAVNFLGYKVSAEGSRSQQERVAPLPGPVSKRENAATACARQSNRRVKWQGPAERGRFQKYRLQPCGQSNASHSTTGHIIAASSYANYAFRSSRPLPCMLQHLSNHLCGGWCGNLPYESESELHYSWQSVSQSVCLAVEPNLGLLTRVSFFFLSIQSKIVSVFTYKIYNDIYIVC